MKTFRLRYRKDEWVSVVVGFADGVNIDDLDHESIATRVAVSGDLTAYERWDGNQVSETSVEVDEIGDGVPDVVIGNDETVMSGSEYVSIKYALFTPAEETLIQPNT